MRTWLVTGGAGFIGSNFVLHCKRRSTMRIINVDRLTYAGNLMNLESLEDDPEHIFVQGDIRDRDLLRELLNRYHPDAVFNFAAESHVDRSIVGPDDFIQTNIVGTFHLLEEVLHYWEGMSGVERKEFRFLQVSTDEVYGSLGPRERPFNEKTPYAPNSPYSASKAAADHLVRAYFHTYGLPTLTTNCSNNYGPRQFPEKLIPLMILNGMAGKPLPIYGDGQNVRDWLYVEDHCRALHLVWEAGRVGEVYNIGGSCEKANVQVVARICAVLDELFPDAAHSPHSSLTAYVQDRPGHDRRYAIDTSKIHRELGWKPEETFETGIRKTIQWYIENPSWVRSVQSGAYREWILKHYTISDRKQS